jgi:hypothetical protein
MPHLKKVISHKAIRILPARTGANAYLTIIIILCVTVSEQPPPLTALGVLEDLRLQCQHSFTQQAPPEELLALS